jgi:hypothetical protein
MLGFNLHCESHNDIIGLLPIVTTHAFHRGVNDCIEDAKCECLVCLSKIRKWRSFNTHQIMILLGKIMLDYLFVIRDPLARMLSAFNYERPNATDPRAHRSNGVFERSKLYEECHFQTLEGECIALDSRLTCASFYYSQFNVLCNNRCVFVSFSYFGRLGPRWFVE